MSKPRFSRGARAAALTSIYLICAMAPFSPRSFAWDAPTLSSSGEAFTTAQAISAWSGEPSAAMRYRLDGAEPTQDDMYLSEGESLVISRAAQLRVRAFISDGGSEYSSDVAAADFVITGQAAGGQRHGVILRADGTV